MAFGKSIATIVLSWVAITEKKLFAVQCGLAVWIVPFVIIPALKFVPSDASPLLTSAPAWAPALYLIETYIGQSASTTNPAFKAVSPPVGSWSTKSCEGT